MRDPAIRGDVEQMAFEDVVDGLTNHELRIAIKRTRDSGSDLLERVLRRMLSDWVEHKSMLNNPYPISPTTPRTDRFQDQLHPSRHQGEPLWLEGLCLRARQSVNEGRLPEDGYQHANTQQSSHGGSVYRMNDENVPPARPGESGYSVNDENVPPGLRGTQSYDASRLTKEDANRPHGLRNVHSKEYGIKRGQENRLYRSGTNYRTQSKPTGQNYKVRGPDPSSNSGPSKGRTNQSRFASHDGNPDQGYLGQAAESNIAGASGWRTEKNPYVPSPLSKSSSGNPVELNRGRHRPSALTLDPREHDDQYRQETREWKCARFGKLHERFEREIVPEYEELAELKGFLRVRAVGLMAKLERDFLGVLDTTNASDIVGLTDENFREEKKSLTDYVLQHVDELEKM